MGFDNEKVVWINRSDKGLNIKIGAEKYFCSIANLEKWLKEAKKKENGDYYGFKLSAMTADAPAARAEPKK